MRLMHSVFTVSKMFVAVVVFLLCCSMTVSAADKIVQIAPNTSYKCLVPNYPEERYKVDLDGDGKEELVIFDEEDFLIINSSKVHLGYFWDAYLYDFNKNDKYREILIVKKTALTLYRYQNGVLEIVGEGKRGGGDKAITSTIIAPIDVLEPSKNNHIALAGHIKSKKTNMNMSFKLFYTIKNGKFVLDQKVTHEGILKGGYYSRFGSYYLRSPLYVYKKSTIKKNRLAFKIKKGTDYLKIHFQKMKVGKKITKIQVKYRRKKGWIFVRTKDVFIMEP